MRYDAERSLSISVYKENKYNTVKAVENITAKLEELQKSMPGYEFHVISNQGDFIGASIREVKGFCRYGYFIGHAGIVRFPAPHQYNLDRQCFYSGVHHRYVQFDVLQRIDDQYRDTGGLALGAGMLIDNAIVVMENIFRNLKTAFSPRKRLSKELRKFQGLSRLQPSRP